MGEPVNNTPIKSRVFIHKEHRSRLRIITLEEFLPITDRPMSISPGNKRFRVKDMRYRDFNDYADAEDYYLKLINR